jgi:hypothetical protein
VSSSNPLPAAQELLRVADREHAAGAAVEAGTDAVLGLVAAARVIDADLTQVLHIAAARGGDPVRLESYLKALQLELRRVTPGWARGGDCSKPRGGNHG